MFGERVGAAGPRFAHFAGRVAGGALAEIGGYGIGMRVFGFADEVQVELHSAGIPTALAPRQSRSKS